MKNIDQSPSRSEWDAYVSVRAGACFSHLYGWAEGLSETYGLPLFRLAVRDGSAGAVVGVLPLMLFAAPGRDPRLISLPYTDDAALLADSAAGVAALLDAALEVAAAQGAMHLELRQGASGEDILAQLLAGRGDHVPHRFKVGITRALPTSADELWRELSAKVRNQVRKARKCGCKAVVGGSELIDDFYGVFSENMRDLGSPVHDLELFHRLGRTLRGSLRVVMVYAGREPAAGAMVFRLGDTLFNPWASSLRRCRPLCANMLLYWAMLAYGSESGCSRFDFGRSSPGAPTCRFKLQWGARMEPLVWHVISLTSRRVGPPRGNP